MELKVNLEKSISIKLFLTLLLIFITSPLMNSMEN